MTDKQLNRPLVAVSAPLVGTPISKEEADALVARNFDGASDEVNPQSASHKAESPPARA
jgi:hypothetical protein